MLSSRNVLCPSKSTGAPYGHCPIALSCSTTASQRAGSSNGMAIIARKMSVKSFSISVLVRGFRTANKATRLMISSRSFWSSPKEALSLTRLIPGVSTLSSFASSFSNASGGRPSASIRLKSRSAAIRFGFGHAARARCSVSSPDPGKDRTLAPDSEEPHPAR